MICQQCAEQGERSRIDEADPVNHPCRIERFHSEDGAVHYHDHSFSTSEMKCTSGHVWSLLRSQSCWCGWKSAEEQETAS